MTSTKYLLCRLGQIFGYHRKNMRLSEAGTESHLLKEAEGFLGERSWRKMENVEAVSVEYWNLRKLDAVRTSTMEQLTVLEKELEEAHANRAKQLSPDVDFHQQLDQEKKEILEALEGLVRERDEIVAKARTVRRNYEGLKLKEEVLSSNGDQNPIDLAENTRKMGELKAEFQDLKLRRGEISDEITSLDDRITKIEEEASAKKAEKRAKAAETFQNIGEGNQRLSKLRSELAILDTQMRQLYTEVGRYASRHAYDDPICRKACAQDRSLVDVMAALRKSIQLNYLLADKS